ncbi:carbohydrate kinase family protein [Aestuariibius sp. 2305UL40-4]|uniref:carbohydrate kinase family protein n=1 Tax=Aestuariibius violaceus TaxID=3234132 RepID=UPI00345E8716
MILCCGEALIDMLPRQTADGQDAFAPHAGGSVFNTAIALGRLGADCGFFSGISTDFFGDLLLETLAASKVDHSLAARSDRPTTLAFVRLEDGQASYAFYDENTAGRMLDVADIPKAQAEAFFFGGISLVTEPCGSAYEAMMRRAAESAVTMIDPNIRPGFIKDEASYRARLARMLAASDIVKVSDEDLRWIAGPGETADLAAALLDRGPSLIAVTEGAKGASGYTKSCSASVEGVPVTVADTVGAGDTFNAGLLAALAEADCLTEPALGNLTEETLTMALSLGARAAAVTVSRAGANPPWRSEL